MGNNPDIEKRRKDGGMVASVGRVVRLSQLSSVDKVDRSLDSVSVGDTVIVPLTVRAQQAPSLGHLPGSLSRPR